SRRGCRSTTSTTSTSSSRRAPTCRPSATARGDAVTSADTGSSRGSVGVAPDGSFQVRFARNLPAAPAGVWARLADPAALAAWLPGSRIDARVGGEVRFDFGDEGAAVGEVTRADPPADGSAALAHAWRWDDLPPSNVEWSL